MERLWILDFNPERWIMRSVRASRTEKGRGWVVVGRAVESTDRQACRQAGRRGHAEGIPLNERKAVVVGHCPCATVETPARLSSRGQQGIIKIIILHCECITSVGNN